MSNDGILKRIEELKTAIAAGVVDVEIRKRSARVRVLQDKLNRMCALIEARAVMYGNQLGESRTITVYSADAEHKAIAEGSSAEWVDDQAARPTPVAFDAALVSAINATLKQAAIEGG
jgi:hypothetical protein